MLPRPDRDEEAGWSIEWQAAQDGQDIRATRPRRMERLHLMARTLILRHFQVDMNSSQISHRQIPLSVDGNGGGCHGVKWHNGNVDCRPRLEASCASIRRPGFPEVDPRSSEESLTPRCRSTTRAISGRDRNNSTSTPRAKPAEQDDGKTGQP